MRALRAALVTCVLGLGAAPASAAERFLLVVTGLGGEREYSERFGIVYSLLSIDRNERVRVKALVSELEPEIASIHDLYGCADWAEREVWDMFGIKFTDHPNLIRILCPENLKGHALRKDHPARATEMEPFSLDADKQIAEQEALIGELIRALTPETHAVATQLAALPLQVKGFGHVRDANAKAAASRRAELLATFRSGGAPVVQAAE